jgi:hypothetical protein
LNNVIERDQRFIKKRITASLGFRSVEGACRTIEGYEAMHAIRKGQVRWVAKGDASRNASSSTRSLASRRRLYRRVQKNVHSRIRRRLFATEPFRREVFVAHYDGVNRSRLAQRVGIGSATVERYFQDYLQRELAERRGAPCPRVLGIDEHFSSKKDGYATTFWRLEGPQDLRRRTRPQRSRSGGLPGQTPWQGPRPGRLHGSGQRLSRLVRKHFPKARIVADRFHDIRLINHHFLACWREIDPVGAKHRGLLSLLRRPRHNFKPEQQTKLEAYFEQIPVLREG